VKRLLITAIIFSTVSALNATSASGTLTYEQAFNAYITNIQTSLNNFHNNLSKAIVGNAPFLKLFENVVDGMREFYGEKLSGSTASNSNGTLTSTQLSKLKKDIKKLTDSITGVYLDNKGGSELNTYSLNEALNTSMCSGVHAQSCIAKHKENAWQAFGPFATTALNAISKDSSNNSKVLAYLKLSS
jgi:hypothetical protein